MSSYCNLLLTGYWLVSDLHLTSPWFVADFCLPYALASDNFLHLYLTIFALVPDYFCTCWCLGKDAAGHDSFGGVGAWYNKQVQLDVRKRVMLCIRWLSLIAFDYLWLSTWFIISPPLYLCTYHYILCTLAPSLIVINNAWYMICLDTPWLMVHLDLWYMTHNTWHMTHDIWHMTHDVWYLYMTRDIFTWYLYMAYDIFTWHMIYLDSWHPRAEIGNKAVICRRDLHGGWEQFERFVRQYGKMILV